VKSATRSIPISRPDFGPDDIAAVSRPLESGWVVQGPYTREFEERFASYVGVPHAAASSSGTTALHLALAALGVRPGDEVIVPAFTWVATANAVEYQGGRPIFCDIDLATYNIDPGQVESLITPRTTGIIPVHLFGLCADMDAIMAIARRHGLWVVEDAACAFGARYGGSHAGTFGDAACFSFHPRKSITTGEGGMVTTARADLDALVRSLRDHGATASAMERHDSGSGVLTDYPHLGFNYRITDIQAALGCAQLGRADEILAGRAAVARSYDQALAGVEWLRRPGTPRGYEHGYQSYVTLFSPAAPTMANVDRLSERRSRAMRSLQAAGIATRQGTHAPVLLTFYREKYGLVPEQFPVATIADRLSLALPLFSTMTSEDIAYVAEVVTALEV
jgi:dTDP-4-amino-4,6-dideoxygalactose transaminase